MKLDELIENSYRLFEKYVIGRTLQVCKTCCVTDEEEARLVNTPLRTVSSELLETAYYRSARNYSDRELWEMKHFLPRVLELVNNFDFPCHSTEIVFARLDLDKPEKWTKEEIELLTEFSVLYFRKCLTFYPFSPENERVATYLVMFGVANFNLKPLLKEWENTNSIEGLLHFKDFVLNDIQYNVQSPYRLTNAFSNPAIDREVINWLADRGIRRAFSAKIEKQIMENKSLDKETLAELSWTYELLQH
ncbi:MAG: hypothetical protein ACN6ON_15235 [Sphingobacterium sp.]